MRETLGRLAALEATIGGLVQGQIEAWEEWPEGYATPNRRIMYAALNWCQEHHTEIVDTLRTLLGGIPLLMPASIDVMTDEVLRDYFQRWWKTPSIEALDRYKLYKLAWDIVGSEFAGRHMLYEKFYAGNSLIVRNQSRPRGAVGAFPRDRGRAADGRGGAQIFGTQMTSAALAPRHCHEAGGMATKRKRASKTAAGKTRAVKVRQCATARTGQADGEGKHHPAGQPRQRPPEHDAARPRPS